MKELIPVYAGKDKIESLAQCGGALAALVREQVVRFLLAKDRKVVKVAEQCDDWYCVAMGEIQSDYPPGYGIDTPKGER